MKKKKLLSALMLVLIIALLVSGCNSNLPDNIEKEITVSTLCKEDADIFGKSPVSLTYTKSEGETDTYSAEITDAKAVSEILEMILNTKVQSVGCQVDMYMIKYEDFCFDFGDEIYTFGFIPNSYVSYGGLYYEITESNFEKIRDILEDYETEDDLNPVSEWYGKDAVLETNFYDNGDEAPSYTEIILSCSEGTLTGGIVGAYDVLSLERKADCFIITYTYGDFYSHEAERQSRITVENGALKIEDLA